MSVFSEISRHYDEIFKVQPALYKFIEKYTPSASQVNLLDIGCGTGSFILGLPANKFKSNGLDLNSEMIEIAKQKDTENKVSFLCADMTEVLKYYPPSSQDIITCLGNTLVILCDKQKISAFLSDVKKLLKPGGKLIIQIVNFEYFIKNNINEFPPIKTDNLTFTRKYFFTKSNDFVIFNTKLLLSDAFEGLESSTELIALKKNDLEEMLKGAGFPVNEFFAGFSEENYSSDKSGLVAVSHN